MREILRLADEVDGQVWRHRCSGPVHRRTHRHDELEFNLVTAGRASYFFNQQRFDLVPGTLIWMFPAQEHVLVNESSDYAMWIVVFRRRLIERVCPSPAEHLLLRQDPGEVLLRQVSRLTQRRLEGLLQELVAADLDPDLHRAGLGYVLLLAWTLFLHAEEGESGEDVHPAVQQAAQLLRDDPRQDSLSDLARRCGLSATRLSRLFHQQTGLTLVDFRNRQRVQRFLDIYGHGRRLNMAAACLRAGFGSYPQFHRVFRKVMGYAPAQYRRRMREA